jgi:dethiobiotin synthetase
MTAWFVTGTDTGVGKTLVACALLHALAERHERVVGMKPVAAGAERDAQGRWINDDVAALRAAGTIAVDAALDNPFLLPDPVSPHIAAGRAGRTIDIATIVRACAALRERADAVVIEGAGGFRVPLTPTLDGADLAAALGLPVILVVGLRLGCLNHALLTAESIAARGLVLAGWVASRIDAAMPEQDPNLALLRARLPAPCVGDVPHLAPPDARRAARHLDLGALAA